MTQAKKGILSWVGLRLAKLIELTEIYSFKDGIKLFYTLYRKRNSYTIKTSFLKEPLYLRDNFSDKAIFQQVFTELQYQPQSYNYPSVKTILDGGANIGMASVFFSEKFPDAKILAVEPEESNYNLLLKNTKAYTNITCLQGAIWNNDESISIANPDSLAASFMVEKSTAKSTILQGNNITSLQKKMGWDSIDLLKLDIEGAEKEVFEGNTQWLSSVKLLIIEVHDHYKAGCSKALFHALKDYDYECFFFHENIFIKFNH